MKLLITILALSTSFYTINIYSANLANNIEKYGNFYDGIKNALRDSDKATVEKIINDIPIEVINQKGDCYLFFAYTLAKKRDETILDLLLDADIDFYKIRHFDQGFSTYFAIYIALTSVSKRLIKRMIQANFDLEECSINKEDLINFYLLNVLDEIINENELVSDIYVKQNEPSILPKDIISIISQYYKIDKVKLEKIKKYRNGLISDLSERIKNITISKENAFQEVLDTIANKNLNALKQKIGDYIVTLLKVPHDIFTNQVNIELKSIEKLLFNLWNDPDLDSQKMKLLPIAEEISIIMYNGK